MATVFTDRFGFPLLTGGSDYPSPDNAADSKDINDALKAVDAVMGFVICTSATHPANPKVGQPIYETDTQSLRYYSGSGNWTTVASATADVKTGTMSPYAGATAPSGYLLCNGASMLRTTYAALFAVVGVLYGSVDGTHFTLPNAKGRSIIGLDAAQTEFNAMGKAGGEKTHILTTNEMPAHKHWAGTAAANAVTGTTGLVGPNSGSAERYVTDLQVLASAGGGAAHNILAPFLVAQYIIKT